MYEIEKTGKNFQLGMDKGENMWYNETEDKKNTFANDWKERNSDVLRTAGDGSLKSVERGLSEANDFANEASGDVDLGEVQDSTVKWALATDANNEALAESARNQLIGTLGSGDTEPYFADVRPLDEFIDAKDTFDFKNGNYTTTQNMDPNYSEDVRNMQISLNDAGYTDKFGQPLETDGHLGAKTQYAIDAYTAAQPVSYSSMSNTAKSSSRTAKNNSGQKILNTPDTVKKLSDVRLQAKDQKLNTVKQQMIKCLSYNYVTAPQKRADIRSTAHSYAEKLRNFDDNSFERIVLLNDSNGANGCGHSAFMMINKEGEALVFSFFPQKGGLKTLLTNGEMRFAVLKKSQVNNLFNSRGNFTISMIASDTDVKTEKYNRYLAFDLPSKSTGYNAYNTAIDLYENPGKYALLFRQCDDIAIGLLNKAGIKAESLATPNTTFEFLNEKR